MKKEQRFKAVVRVCSYLLTTTILSSTAFAEETAAYDGEWSTLSPNLSLKITPQAASFTLEGKTYTATSPSYLNGQLNTSPFLYLADAQQQHRFYLMISEAGGNTAKLNGYYDNAEQSLPIQLTKMDAAPQVSATTP